MIDVTLAPDELLLCQFVGRARSLIARTARVPDAKQGDQDGPEADVRGFAAEFAFAKKHNTFPDLGLTPRSGSADGLVGKFRYDIKSTHYPSGKLLCTLKDNADVDIYVLAIVDLPVVKFPGWVFKDELRSPGNIKSLGHGDGYVLEQKDLRKFKEEVICG